MPTTACNKCIEQIVQWETFYETCHRSEIELKQAKIKADKENNFSAQNYSDSSSDETDDFNDDFFALCVSSLKLKTKNLIVNSFFDLGGRSRLQT